MNNILVTECSNCPFLVADVDYDAVACDTAIYCQLRVYLKLGHKCISAFNSYPELIEECDSCKDVNCEMPYECTCVYKEQEDIITPEDCPLKNNELNIKFDESGNH